MKQTVLIFGLALAASAGSPGGRCRRARCAQSSTSVSFAKAFTIKSPVLYHYSLSARGT
jgi:hypothetical protein